MWISLNDRLPNESEAVLVSLNTREILVGHYETHSNKVEWNIYGLTYEDYLYGGNPTVLAWQPLPKPYEPTAIEP